MSGIKGNRRRAGPTTIRAHMKRKNLKVDQNKVDRLMILLGARSESEVVDQALDLLLFHTEAMAGLRKLSSRGREIENLFDEHLDL